LDEEEKKWLVLQYEIHLFAQTHPEAKFERFAQGECTVDMRGGVRIGGKKV